MDTLLSIIIPVYNVENYLDRCLNSIYSAGCDKTLFEVIAIDDGSTDCSLKILKGYHEENMIVIHQNNLGVSVARNVGLECSKGKFIIFVDPDDYLETKSLKKLVDLLKNLHGTQILVLNSLWDDTNAYIYNWKVGHELLNDSYSGIDLFKKYNWFRGSVWGVVYDRVFINQKNIRFVPKIANGEDSLFFLEVQLYANKIGFYDLDFYRVYNRPNSASKNMTLPKLKKLVRVVKELQDIKDRRSISVDQNELIDYCKYRVFSQMTYWSIKENIGYKTLVRSTKLNDYLPLPCYQHQRYEHRLKFMLLNNYFLYYSLVWLKSKLYG